MKPVQVTVRLSPELAQEFREAVVYARTSAQAVLEQSVKHYVSNKYKCRAAEKAFFDALKGTPKGGR